MWLKWKSEKEKKLITTENKEGFYRGKIEVCMGDNVGDALLFVAII